MKGENENAKNYSPQSRFDCGEFKAEPFKEGEEKKKKKVKLFKCAYCSYECIQKGNLKTHMLAHTNVKLFKCSYCSYECNDKGNLKRHTYTHKY